MASPVMDSPPPTSGLASLMGSRHRPNSVAKPLMTSWQGGSSGAEVYNMLTEQALSTAGPGIGADTLSSALLSEPITQDSELSAPDSCKQPGAGRLTHAASISGALCTGQDISADNDHHIQQP